MDKKEFYIQMGKRIRDYRKSINMSQLELAERAGFTSQTSISKIENGVNGISQTMVSTLAAALGTTPDYIMGWEDEGEQLLIEAFEIGKHSIPLLGNIACGEPIYADEIEYTMLKDAPVDADFALICKGDSMINAGVKDGDVVFIRKQSTVQNGEIAAVIIDDEATLKHVHFDAKNKVMTLLPDNPAYQPMIYAGEDLDRIRILGKAVAYVSYFR